MSNTQPVNLIRFHGLTLLVVEHEGVEYVPLKPLSGIAGIDWRSAKRVMKHPDNVMLYGPKWFGPFGHEVNHDAIKTPSDVLHIRMDRAQIYLSRISTTRMKAHGNIDAAEVLLRRQIDFADAVHHYYITRATVNQSARSELIGELKEVAEWIRNLFDCLNLAHSDYERSAISRLIAEAAVDIGRLHEELI